MLPGDVTFVSASCNLTSTIDHTSGVVNCFIQYPMLPGTFAELTINVTVLPAATGMLHNHASAFFSQFEPVESILDTPVVQPASLNLVKTATPSPAIAGSPLNYTLTVTNTGGTPATNVTINDTLPAGLSYVDSSCSKTATIAEAGGQVSCALSSPLAPGSSATLTIAVQVSPSASGILHNIAVANSTETGPVQYPLDTPVTRSAHLSIIKTASMSPAVAGSSLNYTVVVSNSGPSDALGVTIGDTLPVGVSYQSASCSLPAAITESSGVITCALSSPLAPSASAILEIAVQVSPTASGMLHNLAEADSSETETVEFTLETPVVQPASLSIVKTASESPATAGSPLDYIIIVSNTGGLPAGNVITNDILPANLSYEGASCSLPATISESGGTVTCDLDDPLAPGESAILTITALVNPSASGMLHNLAIADSSETDPVQYPLDTPVTRSASLSIIKTASKNPAIAGGTLTYFVNVTNSGPSEASSVIISDTLPENVTYEDASCDLPAVITVNNGVIVCALSDPLGPGTSATLSIAVLVSSSATGALHNKAVAESPESNPEETVLETPVLQPARLSIIKSANPTAAIAGSTLNYTVTVSNLGGIQASDVIINDTLPAGVTYESASCSQQAAITESNGVVTCILADDLAPGASATLTIDVLVSLSADGTLHNLAAAESPDDGPVEYALDTPVSKSVHLIVVKSADPSTAIAGKEMAYTISVSNLGPSEATAVTISDTLPVGLTYLSATCDRPASITENSGAIVCILSGSLAPGASATLTIDVLVSPSAEGTLRNLAVADCEESEPSEYSLETPVIEPSDLEIVKTANPDMPSPGGILVYTIILTNVGGAPATNVTINDTLPAGLSYLSASCSKLSSISEENGAVVCRLTNALDAGGVATLTINTLVSHSSTGVLHNIAFADSSENDPVQYRLDTTIARAVINVTKSAFPTEAAPGASIIYTVLIENSGTAKLCQVSCQDNLPQGMQYVRDDHGGVLEGPNTIVWDDLGCIAPGENIEIHIEAGVEGTTIGELDNRVEVQATPVEGGDLNPVYSEAKTSIKVIADPLVVKKTADKSAYIPGEEMTFTITVCNPMIVPMKDVVIKDVFQNDKVEIVASYPEASADGLWHYDSLSPGECAEIILVAKAPRIETTFDMEQSVSGKGFVNVKSDLSTEIPSSLITNCVYWTAKYEEASYSGQTCTSVTVQESGSELKTREHGSGDYRSEEISHLKQVNKSIVSEKSVSASYSPTTFSLPGNNTLNYQSRWTEESQAKNYS